MTDVLHPTDEALADNERRMTSIADKYKQYAELDAARFRASLAAACFTFRDRVGCAKFWEDGGDSSSSR